MPIPVLDALPKDGCYELYELRRLRRMLYLRHLRDYRVDLNRGDTESAYICCVFFVFLFIDTRNKLESRALR